MLESLAAGLLNRFLGAYVENFDSKQLNVGIWSGDVKLKNLKLKKESLDALDLPIDVQFGFLGDLTLQVPWSSLKNKPVKILIEDVYLLCGPRNQSADSAVEDAERELRLKMQKLDEFEALSKSQPPGKDDDPSNESFTQSLLTKIVDNVQVSIKNIHVRYEDMDNVFAEIPYSVGITLSELSVVSTDEDWQPSFISITSAITRKLLTLNSLAVYWNADTKSVYHPDHDELFTRLRNTISNKNTIPDHQFLLRPVTGAGRLVLNKAGATDENPHIDIALLFDEFGFDVNNCQYEDILNTLSKLRWYQKTLKFRKNRPAFSVNENPKAWFKYTAEAVLQEVHEKNYKCSWDYIKWRRDRRIEYINLWKMKLAAETKAQTLNTEDVEKLKALHQCLSFNDIKLFRALAKKSYAAERLESQHAVTDSKKAGQAGSSGWFSSWWGGGSSSNGDSDDLVMSAEQKQEFYDAIEFDENKDIVESVDLPPERITAKISCLLNRGSLSIIDKNRDFKLGEMVFERSETEFLQRPDSFFASFKLHELKVEDGSPNTLYKHIVSVKNLQLDDEKHSPQLEEPFFQVALENNPLDQSADNKVDIKLRSMTVFYHVHFINEIIKLFRPPQQHLDTIGAIMSAAEATVEGWTVQTRMGLESILEDHKTVNLSLDLQAPLLIIPLDPHKWDTPCAVIDAGHISIASDLVPKETLKKYKSLSPSEYEKLDSKDIKRLMFDRFKLRLTDTHFLIGPDIRTTISNLKVSEKESSLTILNNLEFELDVDVSILPKALNLPKVKIYGKLPMLKLSLNDYQYKIMMQLIDRCLPDLDDAGENMEDSWSNPKNDPISNKDVEILRQTSNRLNKMSTGELQQRLLQIKFDVEVVQLSVFKCNDAETLKSDLLIDLIGNNLHLDFAKRAQEMDLSMSLQSFKIEDCIDNDVSDEFKNMVSSSTQTAQGSPLFELNFNRAQRIVAYNGTLIEVFDQDIYVAMTELSFVLTPKSILTMLNYTLTTFTNPDAPEMPVDALKHNSPDFADAPQKINLSVNMDNIIIILNDDSQKLATFELSAAEVELFLLPEKMKLTAKLGAMHLTNEIHDELSSDSPMRKLISMSGKELAELSYETYDSQNGNLDYSSELTFKTGSMNVNFVDDSVNRIINFLAKFQKMKILFDKAREAAYNQAGSIESVNNVKLDILVRAPVITFPKLIDPKKNAYDHVSFFLGELSVQNTFSRDGDILVNKIKAGIRSGSLSSLFHMEHEVIQSLSLINNLDLHFDVDHYPGKGEEGPKLQVKGVFEPLLADLTELQLQYLYLLSQSLPTAFIVDYRDEDFDEIQNVALFANTFVSPVTGKEVSPGAIPMESNSQEQTVSRDTDVSFHLTAPQLSLTIYNETNNLTDIQDQAITRISLNNIGLSMKITDGSNIKAETHISSFTVDDIRKMKHNQHNEIIPRVSHDSYQFMASFKREKHQTVVVDNVNVTLDSPRIILALDYLFSLKAFVDASINMKSPAKLLPPSEYQMNQTIAEDEALESKSKFQFSVNIIDSSLILLSDPSDSNTEAIVFNVGQLLLTEQNITSANANNIGMFLCKMQSFDKNRIRLLDDFSASLVIDRRDATAKKLLTNVRISVEPLVMRLALRDIRLAMSIFNKAMALAKENGFADDVKSADDVPTKYGTFSKEFKKTLSRYAPSLVSSISHLSKGEATSEQQMVTIIKDEKLEADFEGLRLVLIGDVHELPIIDMSLKPFSVTAKDWSNDIELLASIETYANIFNYSRSSWEPLLETVPLSFHLSKGVEGDAALYFDVVSRKLAEVSLSSRTIALLSQIPNSLYQKEDTEARGATKPYKIFNDTGMDLLIWVSSKESKADPEETLLENGSAIPWEFEDWRKVRENLDTDDSMNILGVKIGGQQYETSFKIDATSEGEDVYTLHPAIDGVHTRLACELKLSEDNVKLVTIKSTLVLENATAGTFCFKLDDNENEIHEVPPGESRSIPAQKAFATRFYLKPGGNYGWSKESISWKKLLSNPSSIACDSNESDVPFYYEVDAKFDVNEPLARIYPHMKIVISSPLVLENLLPYSMKYKLYWKSDRVSHQGSKDETEVCSLDMGERVLIHSVTLSDYLLLSVHPQDDGLHMSEQALINTKPNSELRPERKVSLRYENGQRLDLKLHYQKLKGSRAKVISIYSPYVVFNGTDRDLQIEGDKHNIAFSKVLLKPDSSRYSKPKMFSFDRDKSNKNRARIKFKDSDWSIHTSFDAIGQSVDLAVEIPNRNQESNIGIAVSEGTGRYALSKVVKILPRYIIRNSLDVDLEVSEYGSSSVMTACSMVSFPLYKMRSIINKHLSIKFLGSQSEWSSPFMIKDIGSSYVKVLKNGSGHQLLKLDIVLEDSTIFINISDAKGQWPYSIRNFSDHEFIFYQRDPHAFDNEEDYDLYDDLGDMKYEPLYYRVPPRSAMPYAWDYPAARQKKLVLVSRQRKREVQLAEIGNLRPMRLSPRTPTESSAIVDLNVVADGPTQALVITNYNPELSLYKLRSGHTTSTSLSSEKSDRFEVREEDKNIFTKFIVSLEGVGISLINTRLQELCYITLSGLELRYNESDLYQTVSVKLKWMQIDNQLFGGIFPNILYPTAIQKNLKELNNHPVLSGSISKVKDDTHGVLYLKHATLLLQELTIQLDEDFLFALIDFAKMPGAAWIVEVKEELDTEYAMLPYPSELQRNHDIYFEVLHLQPTMLHLSFVRTEHLNAEDEKISPQNTLMFFANVLTMALGNINDAPIKLNSLFMDNVKVPLPMLISAVQTHYGQQFFYQIHKILGSADFLGNPVGLFNNISSGVWDIFYEPYQGYMLNDRPQELGISIAKGGLSFVKKSVFGLSDSFARFTGSVAKGLSVATQDTDFQERRRLEQRKAKNSKSINGFGSGATSFVNGVSSGLRGVAFDPYKGASKDGVPGFLKGLGKGLVGLPTKTAIGVLDLASNVSEGIRNTTTVMDASSTNRVRLPRYVGFDKTIKPYSLRESQGQYWLKSANGGECINDKYLAHVVLPGKQLAVIVSLSHVVEVRLSNLEIMWKVRYIDVRSMTLERVGLVITLKNASTELFVPIADPDEKRFLYKNISIAVNEYNKYCQAEL